MLEFSFPTLDKTPIVFGALSKQTIDQNKSLEWNKKFSSIFEAKEEVFKAFLLDETKETCKILITQELKFE